MQAGTISEENLAQILRGISQKRRHGVLEVHAGDKVVEVAFFQGKIVNVVERRQPLARRMAQRFERRGLLSGGEWIAAIENRQQLLQEILQQGERISPSVVQLVQEQQALDDLYGLDLVEGSYYHFRVEMIDTPAEEGLQLSVGQLLLDLVAIKEGRDTFKTRFPDTLVLRTDAVSGGGYGVEESDLIGLVDGKCTIAYLRAHTILGRLCFEETITQLVDSGVLKDGVAPVPAELAFDLSSLDASIDQYAADACRSLEVDQVDQPLGISAGSLVITERLPASPTREEAPASQNQMSSVTIAPIHSRPSLLSELNCRLLENRHTPEIVLGLFVAMALVIPLLVW